MTVDNLPIINENNNNRMSAKMLKFVDEYLVDLNAAAAALRAGYKSGCSGSENLSKPIIQQYIRLRQAVITEKTGINQEWVIERYKKLIDFNIADFCDDKGNLKPLHQIPRDKLYALTGFKNAQQILSESKDGKSITTKNILQDIKFIDKLRALDSIAKHLGFFEKDNMQQQPIIPIQINVTLED